MGIPSGAVAVALIALLTPAAAGAATSAPAADPSCATGPTTIGETTYGTPCADVIVAAPGVETVRGGGGDDTLVAAPLALSAPCPAGCFLGVGSQTFEGGPGDDVVYGQRGNDQLRGGEGNDQLFGGIGDDLLRGGPGNDRLAGGFGADSIDGEAGDDYVHGDGTVDTILDSGGGADTLSYATGVTPGFPNNVAYPNFSSYPNLPAVGGERGVYLNLAAGVGDNGVAPFGGGVDTVAGADFEVVVGTPFSDFIVGSAVSETIYGGGGGDVLLGEGGNDSLRGGADGDHLDGGSGTNALDGGPGSDHCQSPPSGTSCEPANGGGVVLRDPAKVGVGLMAPGETGYSQLYLVGRSAGDAVTATYAAGPPASVTFALEGGSAGSFDLSPAAAAGCGTPTTTEVVCALASPLDSILIAGMGGGDTLHATGFPSSTAVVVIGGEGDDSLTGGEASEDVLVDGPNAGGAGDDVLSALGGDDALLHNGDADQLQGGGGNDLFLSNSVCDGNLLVGGAGRDNASWARFKEGVEARLGDGVAGRPGTSGPTCAGGTPDLLQEVEDLEGSSSADVFYGDTGPNQLLGHAGPDIYFAGAGADSILANSGDSDPTIDCGADVDSALVDRHPQFEDAIPVDCESVREADPNSFQAATEIPLPSPPPVAPGPIAPSPPIRPVDRSAPQTRITAHPRSLVTTKRARRQVVFRFASSEAGSRFRCRLDARPVKTCASPRIYRVALGRHTVRVVAIDPAGNADPSPARFSFRVRYSSSAAYRDWS